MVIYRILQDSAFDPEETDALVRAYEDTLRCLDVANRSDPITNLIAKSLIELAESATLFDFESLLWPRSGNPCRPKGRPSLRPVRRLPPVRPKRFSLLRMTKRSRMLHPGTFNNSATKRL